MDVEESPHALLRAQVPGLSKALLTQIRSPKTATATLQAGFELLNGLLSVIPGSLTTQTPQIFAILKNTLSQSSSTTISGLHSTCLVFLSSYFSTHPPGAFANLLPGITPTLLKTCQERHPRVSSEAFRAFSSLLRALKPIKGGDWVDSLYELSVKKLGSSDTDTDVRGSAEQCIGTLWACATEVMQRKDKKEWVAICRTTGRTEGAVEVVSMVAREVYIDDNWVNGCVAWIVVLLQKSGRSGKADVFTCLDLLLRRSVHPYYFCILTSHTPPRQVWLWPSRRSSKHPAATPSSLYLSVRHPPIGPSSGNCRSVATLSADCHVPTRRTRIFERHIRHSLLAIGLRSCPGITSILLRITRGSGYADSLSRHPESCGSR